jgi:SNF2 family DNA or RNA helicase
MKWTPHKYQLDAVKFMVQRACAGLFLDPGLGKTSISFAAFKILKAKGLVTRALVIAPLRPAHRVWPVEATLWDEFKGIRVGLLHGKDKAKVLADKKVDVHVINPEGLPWLEEQLGTALPWEMLIVDESTRFKHANTVRFKMLRKLIGRFRRRYILTGSPAPNGLLDLFGQVYILDGGHALGSYITHYRMNYFTQTGYGGYVWVPQKGAAERIYEKLKPLVLRMSSEDYLQLPPLIMNTVEVDLPPRARHVYDEMEKLLITNIEDNVLTAANVAVSTGKCRQIANGGIYHEGGKKWSDIHEAKVEAVEEIIESLQGTPALVAYEYVHDLERLRDRLGRDTPFIGGGLPPSQFAKIEAAWNRGDLPVLLAQPQSVAHGLNLQGTHAAVIWHSLTWNLEDYEQFIRRVWRQGQTQRVVVHHVVAVNTVDEAVMQAIKSKDRTQRTLLNALKEYAK